MVTRSVTVMRLAGIPVRLDPSWFILVVIMIWSLVIQFRSYFPGRAEETYWGMAAVVTAGVLLSLFLHEWGHALLARYFGIPVRGVVLYVFGGVPRLDGEPPSVRAEIWTAVAGPVVSMVLAAGFWAAAIAGIWAGWPAPLLGILAMLSGINGALASFNLIPAGPLDGGRVLRAILWQDTGDFRRAAGFTAQLGQALGGALMLLGVLNLLTGLPEHLARVLGLWGLLLGWYIQGATRETYEQFVVRGTFTGEPVRQFMTTSLVAVGPQLDLAGLVDHYLGKQFHRIYPVSEGGRLLGYITPRQLGAVPREEWPRRRVGEVMVTDLQAVRISPDTEALTALTRMLQTGQTQLLVVEVGDPGALLGIVTLRDLLCFLGGKLPLERQST